MWSPTHVQVVVQRAKGLVSKGKHGTNDAYVTIQLGKEKFQTTVQEKTAEPEWHEECELIIPDGNKSTIKLTAYHRNFVSLDKALGVVEIPLQSFDIYERPRNKWYTLYKKEKKSKNDNSDDDASIGGAVSRGELEVRIAFVVKSVTGSLMDLSNKKDSLVGGKKNKLLSTDTLPVKMVTNFGGSLMNISDKKKSPLKHLSNMGHKISEKIPIKAFNLEKKNKALSDQTDRSSDTHSRISDNSCHTIDSEDEFTKIRTSSLSSTVPLKSESNLLKSNQTNIANSTNTISDAKKPNQSKGEESTPGRPLSWAGKPVSATITNPFETKDALLPDKVAAVAPNKRNIEKKLSQPVAVTLSNQDKKLSSSQVGLDQYYSDKSSSAGSSVHNSRDKINLVSTMTNTKKMAPPIPPSQPERTPAIVRIPKEMQTRLEALSKEDLVNLLVTQQFDLDKQNRQIRELEDYIDQLLVRVMETHPPILQNPYKNFKSVV